LDGLTGKRKMTIPETISHFLDFIDEDENNPSNPNQLCMGF
jgi:hypothetical protein